MSAEVFDSPVRLRIHPSQFPEAVLKALLDSLRARRVNHKFLYDSYKQTRKWLALHEACSPARTDEDCRATYARALQESVGGIPDQCVHVIGLGCGGGQKEALLLQTLASVGKQLQYTPVDVGAAMVLVGAKAANSIIPGVVSEPLVCDLATIRDWGELVHTPAGYSRLVTFFGMLPNFEPGQVLAGLASMLKAGDHLLMSANLAPGPDYEAGAQKILPLYANQLTEDWLITFLADLGVERGDGSMRFDVERDASTQLLRVTADFCFSRERTLTVEGEEFCFRSGDAVRLFFSYRHTPERLRFLLAAQGIRVRRQWIAASGEEGVFLAERS